MLEGLDYALGPIGREEEPKPREVLTGGSLLRGRFGGRKLRFTRFSALGQFTKSAPQPITQELAPAPAPAPVLVASEPVQVVSSPVSSPSAFIVSQPAPTQPTFTVEVQRGPITTTITPAARAISASAPTVEPVGTIRSPTGLPPREPESIPLPGPGPGPAPSPGPGPQPLPDSSGLPDASQGGIIRAAEARTEARTEARAQAGDHIADEGFRKLLDGSFSKLLAMERGKGLSKGPGKRLRAGVVRSGITSADAAMQAEEGPPVRTTAAAAVTELRPNARAGLRGRLTSPQATPTQKAIAAGGLLGAAWLLPRGTTASGPWSSAGIVRPAGISPPAWRDAVGN